MSSIDAKTPVVFVSLALLSLLGAIVFGILGAMQYVSDGFLKETIPFHHMRPLHVTLAVTWIFTAATGGIYYYMQGVSGRKMWSPLLCRIHYWLFSITGITIVLSYLNGKFGGREYFEFPPWLSLPMTMTWICFALNFFLTLKPDLRKAPVYIWMWTTGIVFFLLTFAEQYLWMIPWFRDNPIRDLTVQWKSMGAIVGSWNQLIYGTAFYLMEKISGNEKIARSRTTFFFYFLGLTNLMFNWGHHTYPVPAAEYIRTIAYVISMTELIILGSIMLNWSRSVSEARKTFHLLPSRFLAASDVWIFLNLALAIAISVPAINRYTHGTHITVAHAMGATLGINTMILFASLIYISEASGRSGPVSERSDKNSVMKTGFWILNFSLLLFWLSLIGAGVAKAVMVQGGVPFSRMMKELMPWYYAFAISGVGVAVGIAAIAGVQLRSYWRLMGD